MMATTATATTTLGQSSLVLTSISGGGKDTMIEMLIDKRPDKFVKAINHTTRPKRSNEIDGVSYHFIAPEEFDRKLKNGDFIEHVTVHNNYYGLSFQSLKDVFEQNKIPLLTLDVHGVEQFQIQKLSATFVWLSCPSREEQIRRLQNRGDSQESIDARIQTSVYEEGYYAKNTNKFDYNILNDTDKQDDAFLKLWNIIIEKFDM